MIKGKEIMYTSNNGNISVAYAKDDLGEKYKVYRKVRYDENLVWEYVIGFNNQCEALKYVGKMLDVVIVR